MVRGAVRRGTGRAAHLCGDIRGLVVAAAPEGTRQSRQRPEEKRELDVWRGATSRSRDRAVVLLHLRRARKARAPLVQESAPLVMARRFWTWLNRAFHPLDSARLVP